ncbi:hypothetical protein FIBSPDRAFT_1035700 [Athelia psychrophila]|uniref:CREG-like beta-barrel domain-containing protein n=1 Tax=Athelia psychrophila TaxID=1759441 RepID=A0A166XF41_9AGAM|nr:hypothetical protein FIBSPDRAFT_1035700 [Fibularhizoctonia sp. CBS 109695]
MMFFKVNLLSLVYLIASLVCSRAYETVEDAAVIARRLVDDSPNFIATMATVYPSDHPHMAGQPFALQAYYSTYYQNGSLLLLVLPISRHTQNIMQSPGHTASLTMASPLPAARSARVSLAGNVTIFWDDEDIAEEEAMKAFYLAQHPDAKRWLPNDDGAAHIAFWARFDPQDVYFVGGFGTTHYIGGIPLDLYQRSSSKRGVAGRLFVTQYA